MKKWTKKQKEEFKSRVIIVSAITLICILTLTGGLTVYQKIMRSANPPVPTVKPANYAVPKPEMQEALLTENPNSRPGIALKQVRGIVIHYTANPGTDAMANRNYFENRKDLEESARNKVSSHFVVGLDGRIIQCIPLDEIAYASNDRNQDTISIECCHPEKNGKFTEETRVSVIRLAAWLCGKYALQKKDIIRHYDVTGKMCPRYYVKHPKKWIAMQADIVKEMKKYKVKKSQ